MATRRKKGIQAALPIVYGNETSKLPDDAPELQLGHTHRWTVYVRGPNGADISHYVRKVVFRLHESFTNAVRTIEAPPFEVTETGWGEFEIVIAVHLHDFPERPIKLTHMLRLFPPEDQAVIDDPSRPDLLVMERYDEIVLNEPTEAFYDQFLQNISKTYPMTGPVWNRVAEIAEAEMLDRANLEVLRQMEELRRRIMEKDQELARVKAELAAGAAMQGTLGDSAGRL